MAQSKPKTILCLNSLYVMNPGLIGLEGENLIKQDWLQIYTDGAEARAALALRRTNSPDDNPAQVWVFDCDDMKAFNVGAALKADDETLAVFAVAENNLQNQGKCQAAHIDQLVSQSDFVLLYNATKEAALRKPVTMGDSPEARRPALLMTFVSGRGGCGKTSAAALAAHIFQGYGLRTLLLDFDLQFGNLAQVCTADKQLTVDKIAADDFKPSIFYADQAQAGGNGPVVVGAPHRAELAEKLAEKTKVILDRAITNFDVVVVDVGSIWSESTMVLLERSYKVVFMVDQRPSTLQACRHAIELCQRCGVATTPFVLAVNRCKKGALYSAVDVAYVLQGIKVYELLYGGAEAEELIEGGQVARLAETRNPLSDSVRRMIDELCPLETLAPELASSRSSRKALFASRGLGKKAQRPPLRGAHAAGSRAAAGATANAQPKGAEL